MVDQVRVVTLKCSSCGSNLEIGSDLEQFACGYCGAQLVVERRGGIIALKQMADAVARVQVATDKTAAELALRRLSDELSQKESLYASVDEETALEVSQSSAAAQRVGAIFFILAIISGIVAITTWSESLGVAVFFTFATACFVGLMVVSVRVNKRAAARAEGRREETLARLSREVEVLKGKIQANRKIVDA